MCSKSECIAMRFTTQIEIQRLVFYSWFMRVMQEQELPEAAHLHDLYPTVNIVTRAPAKVTPSESSLEDAGKLPVQLLHDCLSKLGLGSRQVSGLTERFECFRDRASALDAEVRKKDERTGSHMTGDQSAQNQRRSHRNPISHTL